MIKNLEIRNFKSIRELKLDCKRVNIFIGEPNTGKSNILESVGIFSFPFILGSDYPFKKLIRYETTTNLFYDNEIEKPIFIGADEFELELKFAVDTFVGECRKGDNLFFSFSLNFQDYVDGRLLSAEKNPFKFYKFEVINYFSTALREPYLLPPRGDNLLEILLMNKDLRKRINELVKPFELKIVLKPNEQSIEVQKEIEDVVIAYPYSLLSYTLQRIIFYLVAIETNENSILIFEEPEAHSFPHYTKLLAEKIALDENDNQYFISTHSPYFIYPIIEKAKKDVNIFITYYKDFQTQVKAIEDKEIEEIIDLNIDPFLNLDKFIKEK
ncbi:MAG: AAA family ATPase [candidate division WOR-3 bacterium]